VYRQELLKVEKSTKSGAGVDDIYQPKLIWYKRAEYFSRFVRVFFIICLSSLKTITAASMALSMSDIF
jgi:hypothetical protein